MTFDDEEQGPSKGKKHKHKKDGDPGHHETPKGYAVLTFDGSQQLTCVESQTHRIVRGFRLIKASDEKYTQTRELMKATS